MNHAAINALVAERVMGWKFWLETRGEYLYVIPQRTGDREPWTRYRDGESHKERYKPITTAEFDSRNQIHLWRDNFDPSRNIAHAHEMRDKVLRENPLWYLSTNHQLNAHGQMVHFATVCKPELVSGFFAESGLEEPTVLCLAVLRAIGVPDKEIEEVCGGE